MSCKQGLDTYSMMSRCPLEDAARIKMLADEANVTISNFVADMVNERVKGVRLTSKAREWIAAHREQNKARREKVDEAFASGKYKTPKKRGRSKKRGRPKGVKNSRKDISVVKKEKQL